MIGGAIRLFSISPLVVLFRNWKDEQQHTQ